MKKDSNEFEEKISKDDKKNLSRGVRIFTLKILSYFIRYACLLFAYYYHTWLSLVIVIYLLKSF